MSDAKVERYLSDDLEATARQWFCDASAGYGDMLGCELLAEIDALRADLATAEQRGAAGERAAVVAVMQEAVKVASKSGHQTALKMLRALLACFERGEHLEQQR